MSWVTDISDIVKNFRFYDTVDEGQVGLNLRLGVAKSRCMQYKGDELREILDAEKEVVKNAGGKLRFVFPFSKIPNMPEGYGRSFWTGLPKHPKRYVKDVNLQPGFYWLIPVVDSIYMDHNQERRIVSKAEDMAIVPTTDGDNVAVGFIMFQKIEDYYTAYTRGDDYEDLLRGEASSILAKLASGRSTQDWTNPENYKDIADHALEKLKDYTTKRWGVGVSKFALTQIMINPNIIVGYGISPQATPAAVGTIGVGAPVVPR
jgi:hypothetical protein